MRILIIDEKGLIAQEMFLHFAQLNFSCQIVYSIDEGKRVIDHTNFECIVLSALNSTSHVVAFLTELRAKERKEGVIVVSENKSRQDMVATLNNGADDYLTQPIDFVELTARIEAVVRRKYSDNNYELRFKNMVVNMRSKIVLGEDGEIHLTGTEYELLRILLLNKGRVVSKEELAERLTGQSDVYFYNFDILYTHIKNLKQKLRQIGGSIKSVYGTGYKISQ